jgi:hypothetical protein
MHAHAIYTRIHTVLQPGCGSPSNQMDHVRLRNEANQSIAAIMAYSLGHFSRKRKTLQAPTYRIVIERKKIPLRLE